MMHNFQALPLSLNALITQMEQCKDLKDLAGLVGLKSAQDEKITLEKFLHGMEFPVESYSDLTNENFKKFVGRVRVLFPLQNEREKAIFSLFRERIEEKIVAVNRNTVSLPTLYTGTVLVQNTSIAISMTFEGWIKQAEELLSHPPEIRLADALSLVTPPSASKKANMLQIILSLLVMEQQAMQLIQNYAAIGLESIECTQKSREGSAKVLRLNAVREVTLFELPSSLDEPEAFASWLSLCPYLEIREHEGKSYACIVPIEKWKVDASFIESQLHLLRSRTTDSSVLFLIDKIFLFHKKDALDKKLYIAALEQKKFRHFIEESLLVRETFPSDLEARVTPIGYQTLTFFKKHLERMLTKSLQDLPKEDFEQFDVLARRMQVHQAQQEAFYEFAYQALKTIVSRARDRRSFIHHMKNLFVAPENASLALKDSIKVEPKPAVAAPKPTGLTGSKIPKSSQKKIGKKHTAFAREDSRVMKVEESSTSSTSSSTRSQENFSLLQPDVVRIEEEHEAEVVEVVQCAKALSAIPLTSDKSASTQLPGQAFPYTFAERVARWHHYPFGTLLPAAEFPEYSAQSPQFQEKMHVYHVLHPFVDRFLGLGIQAKWINRRDQKEDLRIVIVAEVAYKCERKRGVIVYTINVETGECYHKFFSEKIDRDILCQVITKTFDENDFPELKSAILSTQQRKAIPVQMLSGTITVDPVFKYVDIRNPSQNLHIRLLKVESV